MKAQNNGIWNQWQADQYHQNSPKLAKWIEWFLAYKNAENDPVYDMGCGVGYYIHHLENNGFTCYGIEGFKLNNFMCSNPLIMDLTKPIEFERKGSVISLEVGEHLDKSAEQTFLNTVTNACKENLILSWAELGQPGVGHVNTQPQEYIISEVKKRGFKHNEKRTLEAREQIDECCNWFRRTLLVFERIG
jgi:hypothetical protein